MIDHVRLLDDIAAIAKVAAASLDDVASQAAKAGAKAAGNYLLETRVASGNPGGTFHLEFNGVDKTGLIDVPNTGGWQTYQTVVKTGISLAAGQQVVRVVQSADRCIGAGQACRDDVGHVGEVGRVRDERVAPALRFPAGLVQLGFDLCVMAAAFFVALTIPMARFTDWVGHRVARRERGGGR